MMHFCQTCSLYVISVNTGPSGQPHPANKRLWPTNTNSSTGPLVVAWLAEVEVEGSGQSQGDASGPQVVAVHGIGKLLGR